MLPLLGEHNEIVHGLLYCGALAGAGSAHNRLYDLTGEKLPFQALNRGRPSVPCAYCGDNATHIVELAVFERQAPRSGRSRGKHVRTVSRRVCARHALGLAKIIQSPPGRQHGAGSS